jgi:5-formyltetrahydrofolate cyclo-ligase
MDVIEIKAWRRAERERLIAARMAVPATQRRQWGEAMTASLAELLTHRGGILGIYWPFRGEFDPRPLVDALTTAGRCVALPVVLDKKGPLEYRAWAPGEPLVAGVWDIPIPERREIVVPATVLAPVVGFDRAGYRLGYGGGYFDRTLASLDPRPLAIGVGFSCQAIETIYPQSFDVPMDVIVTETGVTRR